MPVPKADGTFRLCGDYKVTLNAALEVDQHPLPKPEEIFVSLARLCRYTRLLFGVASTPAIFQRTMDQALLGLPGVMCT